MARKRGSHDIAPQIRGAWKRAVLSLEDKGKPLSTIIEKCLEENPLATLKAISAFVPKEMLLEADITTKKAEELTDDELLSIATSGSDGTADEAESTSKPH